MKKTLYSVKSKKPGLASVYLFIIFFPFYIVHIAALGKLFMESETAFQVLRSLSLDTHFKVFVQQWTVIRMNAVVDDATCTLDR